MFIQSISAAETKSTKRQFEELKNCWKEEAKLKNPENLAFYLYKKTAIFVVCKKSALVAELVVVDWLTEGVCPDSCRDEMVRRWIE